MGQWLFPIRPSAHCLEARRATRKASPKQVPACQGDSGELWRTAGWEASAVVMLCYDSNSCTPSQKHWNHWNQTLQSAGWPACKQSSRESSSSSCASGNVALGNLPGILDLGILHLIFQHPDDPGQNRRV